MTHYDFKGKVDLITGAGSGYNWGNGFYYYEMRKG